MLCELTDTLHHVSEEPSDQDPAGRRPPRRWGGPPRGTRPRGLPRVQQSLARRPSPRALMRCRIARGGGAGRCRPGARTVGGADVAVGLVDRLVALLAVMARYAGAMVVTQTIQVSTTGQGDAHDITE